MNLNFALLVLGFALSTPFALAGGGGYDDEESLCRAVKLGVISSCRTAAAYELEHNYSSPAAEQVTRVALELTRYRLEQDPDSDEKCAKIASEILSAELQIDAYPLWMKATDQEPGRYFSAGFETYADFAMQSSGTLSIDDQEFETPNHLTRMKVLRAQVDLTRANSYVLHGVFSQLTGPYGAEKYVDFPFTAQMICKPLSALPPPSERHK